MDNSDKSLLILTAFIGILSVVSIYLSSVNINQSIRIEQLKKDSADTRKVLLKTNTELLHKHDKCVTTFD